MIWAVRPVVGIVRARRKAAAVLLRLGDAQKL